MHAIYGGDADTANDTVDKHLTGTALAYATFETAVTAVEAMAMDGETCLMKGCGDGLATLATDGLSVKMELYKVFLGNGKYRMLTDFIHCKMLVLRIVVNPIVWG